MSGPDSSHRRYLSELFALHYRWLCARLKRLDSHDSAEDVACETFLQLLASPNVLPIREPRALLITIARRLVYQRWRRRDLEHDYLQSLEAGQSSHADSPEERAAALQSLARIEQRLNRLPAKVKKTFVLARNEGLTYPEIAAQLSISMRSVSSYMQKAETCCLRAGLE